MRNEEKNDGKADSCLFSLPCFLPGALSPKPAQAGKDPYPDLIDYIAPEVRKILAKHGLPVKENYDNPWFKWDGTPSNYTINFYLADEIPQAAILETIRFCMDLYEKQRRKEQFNIFMYRESHAKKIKLFSGVEPFFELTIKGEN